MQLVDTIIGSKVRIVNWNLAEKLPEEHSSPIYIRAEQLDKDTIACYNVVSKAMAHLSAGDGLIS